MRLALPTAAFHRETAGRPDEGVWGLALPNARYRATRTGARPVPSPRIHRNTLPVIPLLEGMGTIRG